LRVSEAEGLRPEQTPFRVRLTRRDAPRVEAGDLIAITARLMPPPRAALPGGHDFARDAYFARICAVGSVLGRIATEQAPAPPGLGLRLSAAIDRARNALAQRIFAILGGDEGRSSVDLRRRARAQALWQMIDRAAGATSLDDGAAAPDDVIGQ